MWSKPKWASLTVLVLLLISCPIVSESQLSIASIWKARAFEANDNLESLEAKIQKYPQESKQAIYLTCKIMIEFAFAGHIALEDTVHKKEADSEVFHIVLNGGEKEGLFDLAYVYKRDGKHQLTRIDRLPKDWHLTILPEHPGMLGLRSSGGRCIFAFDVSNPFQASAIEP